MQLTAIRLEIQNTRIHISNRNKTETRIVNILVISTKKFCHRHKTINICKLI